MTDRKSDSTSESEEMYLLTIARMAERGDSRPVPLSQIADTLGLQTVSVHQMIRKLEENGLVQYYPYKGVLLTDSGEKIAYRTLRFHRLWEVFLTRHLGFTTEQASDIACELEHASTLELASRLEQYLEKPRRSPSGKPIPGMESSSELTLSELGVGRKGIIMDVHAEEGVSAFLASEGIFPDVEVSLLGTGSCGDLLLDVSGHSVHLGRKIAENIRLRADSVRETSAADE